MNAVLESARFAPELGGWSLRGGLCAVPSFLMALVIGFNSPGEIAGMLLGVVSWVAIFAVYCTWRGSSAPLSVRALKIATWIKLGASVAGGLGFGLASLVPEDSILGVGVLGLLPDGLPGFAAISLTRWLGGYEGGEFAKLDSVGWTVLATFVDGCLFVVIIGLLAMALLLWWWVGAPRFAKFKLSPARLAG